MTSRIRRRFRVAPSFIFRIDADFTLVVCTRVTVEVNYHDTYINYVVDEMIRS